VGSVARGARCVRSRESQDGCALGRMVHHQATGWHQAGDWKAEQRHLVVGGEPAEVKYQAESHCQLLSQGTRTAWVVDEP
jgi:hypothetical protein